MINSKNSSFSLMTTLSITSDKYNEMDSVDANKVDAKNFLFFVHKFKSVLNET